MLTSATTSGISDPLIELLSAEPGGELAGTEPGWLNDARARARDHFMSRGLPTKKDESWRYTDLKRVRRSQFRGVAGEDVTQQVSIGATLVPSGRAAARVVFVNGRLRADLSELDTGRSGIEICSLATAVKEQKQVKLIERNLETLDPVAADRTASGTCFGCRPSHARRTRPRGSWDFKRMLHTAHL
ncbi:MAG: hypothetical protein HC834_01425 [Rhodospirillales bacterium]|nr:hypothetical protein [Rhodospirillales bacterium]